MIEEITRVYGPGLLPTDVANADASLLRHRALLRLAWQPQDVPPVVPGLQGFDLDG